MGAASASADAAGVGIEERRHVTVVFADVIDSTASAEALDVEDVRTRLLRFHGAVTAALERHGGAVEKYIGDAVVAVFGSRRAHEDDALRAVRAALEARDAVGRLSADEPWLDLHLRLGVDTGEALVAVDAAPDRSEALIAGDVMNTAARIQSAAPVDGVLVGRDTFASTQRAVRYRRHKPVAAKGKATPVEVWEALAERRRPLARQTQAPFVGRDAELAMLLETWREVVDRRRGRLVTVVGPAGAGKTRLLDEALSGLAATVLRGRCLAYGEGITYWPLGEALSGAQVPQAVGANSSEDRTAVGRALAVLVGIGKTGASQPEHITRAELHWGIRRLLEWSAAEHPVVLVVEDVHWAEPTLLELLASLAEVVAPLLVLTTSRDPSSAAGDIVELPPLGDFAALALVDGLLGTAAHPEVRASLVARAAGNPLFLEETIRAISVGGLRDAGAGLTDLPVPDAVRALVGSRLDRLPARTRRLLGAAAVVGTVFWDGAVARLIQSGVRDELAQLLDEELVYARPTSSLQGEREYAFHHDLFRDVAYERVPKGIRAEMHAACADWVVALPGASELVEIAASHLERSCLLLQGVRRPTVAAPVDRAVLALEFAAVRAERREGFSEAERYLGRALALLPANAPAGDLLAVRRHGLEVSLGRLDEALKGLTALLADEALAERSPGARGRALVWLANLHVKQGRPEAARICLEDAERVARTTGDAAVGARAAYELSSVLASFAGDLEHAIAELERGRELAASCDEPGLALEGHLRRGFYLVGLGRPDEAERELVAVVSAADELGRTRDGARALMELSFVRLYFQGDERDAEALARRALGPLIRAGDQYFVAQDLGLLSKLALARGDPREAAALAREAIVAARPIGGWAVVTAQAALVDALLDQGLLEEARIAAAAARFDLPFDDSDALISVLCAEAQVAAASGDLEEARATFARAIVLVDERGEPLDRAVVRLSLTRALRGADDTAAAETLGEVRAICEGIGAHGLLRTAERQGMPSSDSALRGGGMHER